MNIPNAICVTPLGQSTNFFWYIYIANIFIEKKTNLAIDKQ